MTEAIINLQALLVKSYNRYDRSEARSALGFIEEV